MENINISIPTSDIEEFIQNFISDNKQNYVEELLEEIDYDSLSSKVIDEIDHEELASNIQEHLDFYDLASTLKDYLDMCVKK